MLFRYNSEEFLGEIPLKLKPSETCSETQNIGTPWAKWAKFKFPPPSSETLIDTSSLPCAKIARTGANPSGDFATPLLLQIGADSK